MIGLGSNKLTSKNFAVDNLKIIIGVEWQNTCKHWAKTSGRKAINKSRAERTIYLQV